MRSRPEVTRPWQMVSMDIMGPLPRTHSGYSLILVITDYLSKFCLLFALRKATARSVARHVEESLFQLFGAPQYIICDNGVPFKSNLFQQLCEEYHVKIWFTASYHPQANPTERTNRVIKTMLATYITENHRNWDTFLQKVGCAISTAVFEVTKLTPYFVNFGREHVPYGDMHCRPNFAEQAEIHRTRPPDGFKKMYLDVQGRLNAAHDKAKHR